MRCLLKNGLLYSTLRYIAFSPAVMQFAGEIFYYQEILMQIHVGWGVGGGVDTLFAIKIEKSSCIFTTKKTAPKVY